MRGSILRGMRCRCPECGIAKLYQAYLKPIEICPTCNSTIADVCADDGPSWLTVLVLGPPLSILILMISFSHLPPQLAYPLMVAVSITLVLSVLPSMKGAFIGALWHFRSSQKKLDMEI